MSTIAPQTKNADEELVAASMPDHDGPMWISPEMATLWLARNVNNRKVRFNRINTMARDMAMDHWRYTGEAIKFDVAGRLLDGQHRLMAIVKANVTVKMLVIVGLDEDAQSYMDAGARRTAADALNFRNEAQASFLAASVRLGIVVERGANTQKDPISNAEIIEWLTYHSDIRRSVGQAARYTSKYDLKPSTMGYGLWRMTKVDEEECEYFFRDIIEMRTDGPGDPVYTLLARLRTARKNREHMTNLVELNFLSRTWNARRMGQELKILKFPAPEFMVVPFK